MHVIHMNPMYAYIPIDAEQDHYTSHYGWTSLSPNDDLYKEIGTDSPAVLNMLILNASDLTYTLRDCHRHLLEWHEIEPTEIEHDITEDLPDISDDLPAFDPNFPGLPPLDEGGPSMDPLNYIPRTEDSIPDHIAYRKVD